jgi:hypothetical protein
MPTGKEPSADGQRRMQWKFGSGARRCAEGMVDSRPFLTQSVGRWLHRRSSNDMLPARLLTTPMVINPALDIAIAAKARVHELTIQTINMQNL